ncbi:hypothetical protein RCL1_004734 [Eukaryota sp. TZLM3-RCL]
MSTTSPINEESSFIFSHIPSRLDRLPFSKFHLLICFGLSLSWLLDGLAVSNLNIISPILERIWDLSDTETGATVTVYLVGCVLGSLFFGSLMDSFGKKTLYRVLPNYFCLSHVTTVTLEFLFNV